MKNLLFIIILALFMPVFGVCAAQGDVAGDIYYTDIKTVMYYAPITSYNIGGKTVIDAEILNWHYGFDVYWLAEQRKLDITDKGGVFVSLQAMAGDTLDTAEGSVGEVAGHYYYTDIKTFLNGREIESYNIGGRTFIVAEEMVNCGYNTEWNASQRTLTISKKMDFYTCSTELGDFKLMSNPGREGVFAGQWQRGIIFSGYGGEDETETAYMPQSGVRFTPGGISYVALKDLQELFGARCSLKETVSTSRSEWVNGINYEYDYYTYIIEFDFDKENLKLETKPVSAEYEFKELDFSGSLIQDISGVGFSVNGEEIGMTALYGGKTFYGSMIVIDGAVYVPAYTAAKILGCKYAY